MSTTTAFTDVGPFVEISNYIFAWLRFSLTSHESDLGFQVFNKLWIIYIPGVSVEICRFYS